MAEEGKRQGDDSAAAAAAAKKQRSEEREGKEEHAADDDDGGGKAAVTGEEILTWLVDYDEQSMSEVMDYLLPPPPAAGTVSFTNDPYSAALPAQSPSSSYITINTGNEESCGSSYSEAASFMASLAAPGATLTPIAGGGEESSPGGGMPWFEALPDDTEGGDFLTEFLGEDDKSTD